MQETLPFDFTSAAEGARSGGPPRANDAPDPVNRQERAKDIWLNAPQSNERREKIHLLSGVWALVRKAEEP
jgi:hypothetical protein